MKTQGDKFSYLPVLITSIAVVLFSTAGIARMMGWGPNSTDDSGDILALDHTPPVPPTTKARAKPRCAGCGVIVSMQEIERQDEGSAPGTAVGVTAGNRDQTGMKSTKRYEFIVRMAAGSTHVIEDAAARWRTGERVIVIDGVARSNR